MSIVTVGIDLAKNVFALHGVDQYGKAIFIKPKVARSQLLEMVAHLPPCLICEAVTRPHMRFVPVKDIEQQAILCLHRTRQGFIEERTALYNRLRGLISEFGIVLPQKVERLRREIGAHLELLPGWANRRIGDLLAHADRLNERIADYDRAIAEAARPPPVR